jgi:hypothetical protein
LSTAVLAVRPGAVWVVSGGLFGGFGWFECDGVADGFELALESAGAVLG